MLGCRLPFLVVAVLAAGVASGQQPAQGAGQGKATAQQSQADGQTKSGDSSVFVIQGPKAPPPSPQFAPELRTIDLAKRPKVDETTRMLLIQSLDAEFVHSRRYFPLGDKSIMINPQGQVSPGDAILFQQMQAHGVAAKVGDKVQITNVIFHDRTITVQINGGPKKHGKWYDHVSIGVGGDGGVMSPTNPNDNQATGAEFTLQFPKEIPQMTGDELRKLLSPVLDFSLKSAAQVYAETLPPKIRDAIKNHQVLVGMNHDMVVMAKDRPPQKVREKDDKGKEYEEWIYGEPPQDVVFVRFVGDEVTQVKTAKAGGEITVKTEKEVDVKDGVATLAALQASSSPQDVKQHQQPEDQQPPKPRPTLRRPDEQPDVEVMRAPNGQTQPTQGEPNEPEWGTNGKQPQTTQPPPQTTQPPAQTTQPPSNLPPSNQPPPANPRQP